MAITRVTDHTRRAILHLPPPHWGLPRIAGCVRAITDEVQELEDVIWDILTLRLLDNADSVRLATIGRLVGEPDLGYSTETYRGLIRFRIRLNMGKATARDFIEIAKLIGANSVEWRDGGFDGDKPAHLFLQIEDAESISFPMLDRFIQGAAAAGVTVDVIFVGAEHGLRFDDASGAVALPDAGVFGDARVLSMLAAPVGSTAAFSYPIASRSDRLLLAFVSQESPLTIVQPSVTYGGEPLTWLTAIYVDTRRIDVFYATEATIAAAAGDTVDWTDTVAGDQVQVIAYESAKQEAPMVIGAKKVTVWQGDPLELQAPASTEKAERLFFSMTGSSALDPTWSDNVEELSDFGGGSTRTSMARASSADAITVGANLYPIAAAQLFLIGIEIASIHAVLGTPLWHQGFEHG